MYRRTLAEVHSTFNHWDVRNVRQSTLAHWGSHTLLLRHHALLRHCGRHLLWSQRRRLLWQTLLLGLLRRLLLTNLRHHLRRVHWGLLTHTQVSQDVGRLTKGVVRRNGSSHRRQTARSHSWNFFFNRFFFVAVVAFVHGVVARCVQVLQQLFVWCVVSTSSVVFITNVVGGPNPKVCCAWVD